MTTRVVCDEPVITVFLPVVITASSQTCQPCILSLLAENYIELINLSRHFYFKNSLIWPNTSNRYSLELPPYKQAVVQPGNISSSNSRVGLCFLHSFTHCSDLSSTLDGQQSRINHPNQQKKSHNIHVN